jgi:LPXTG cell wall anchor motif
MTTTMGRGHTWQRKSLAILAAVALFASLVTVFAPRAEAEHDEYFPGDAVYNHTDYWENYLNGHDGVDNSVCVKDDVGSDSDFVADGDYRLVIIKKASGEQANRLYWNVSSGDVLAPGPNQGNGIGYSHVIVCTNTPRETTTTTEATTTTTDATTTTTEGTTTTTDYTTTTTGYPEPGKIVVWKYVTDGSNVETEFWFETDFSFGPNPLSDGEMGMSGELNSGIYSVVEILPEGWELEDAWCDDHSDPSAIDVSEGETVTCTFLNTEVDSHETTTTSEATTTTTEATTTTTEGTTTTTEGTTTTTSTDPGLPEIGVTKTAGVETVEAPGENVTFTVVVSNLSDVEVTITSLEDDVYGTLTGDDDCEVGTVLAVGASCSFDFVGFVGGVDGDEHHNTVTVNGEDITKHPVTASNDENVHVRGTEVKDTEVLPFTGASSDILLVAALILLGSGAVMVGVQRRREES